MVFVIGVLTKMMRWKVALAAYLVGEHLDFVIAFFQAGVLAEFVFPLFLPEVLTEFVFPLFLVEVLTEFVFLLEGKGLVAARLAIVPVSVRHGCENDLCL